MAEGAAVAQPVKERPRSYEGCGIGAILPHRRIKLPIGQQGQRQKELAQLPTEPAIGQIPQENPAAMILVEKNIHEIHLVGIFPQPQGLVESIVEMKVKNHLAHESRIEQQQISKDEKPPQCIAYFIIGRQESSRNGNQHQRKQEGIGVPVQSPTQAIGKALKPLAKSLFARKFLRAINLYEEQAKQTSPKRHQQEKLEILLNSRPKQRKHRLPSPPYLLRPLGLQERIFPDPYSLAESP